MEIYVFSPGLTRIGIIDSYISLTWEEFYQEAGRFTLVATDAPENIALLRQGNIIFQPGKDTAMHIKYVKYDSVTRQISACGFSTLNLLAQRVVAAAESVHNAEQSIYDIARNNLRGLPNVALADAGGLTEVYDTQYTGGSILEAAGKIAVETGLGLKMLLDYRGKRHVFKVYKGVSRVTGQADPTPAIFSEEFGNLANMTVTDDISLFKNVAYVAGAGEGSARKIVTVGDAAGLERHELWVDARDIQPDGNAGETVDSPSYIQRLENRGIDKLNERIRVQTFKAEVDAGDFRLKYDLGDIISCKSTRYGVQLNTRIMHFKEITERNITKTYLTLGNPEITLVKELILSGAT